MLATTTCVMLVLAMTCCSVLAKFSKTMIARAPPESCS